MSKDNQVDMEISQHPKTILIIDDEENMRHMLQTLLTRHGYGVSTAEDGLQGLDLVNERQFDFIFCDLKMPRMDGMAFLKSGRDRLLSSTVIMMSAYGTIDMAVEAMKLGAYDFISKPFKNEEIRLTIKKAEERERLKKREPGTERKNPPHRRRAFFWKHGGTKPGHASRFFHGPESGSF
jgi:two-component system, NtrC family, response regulator AtoC